MSPLLRENISASHMEGIISVETWREERGRLKKMDTSFTVCRQGDGTILRYAEYEPRYSEWERRNTHFQNKQVTLSELFFIFCHTTCAAVKLQIFYFLFIRIIRKHNDVDSWTRPCDAVKVTEASVDLAAASSSAPRADAYGVCSDADMTLLQGSEGVLVITWAEEARWSLWKVKRRELIKTRRDEVANGGRSDQCCKGQKYAGGAGLVRITTRRHQSRLPGTGLKRFTTWILSIRQELFKPHAWHKPRPATHLAAPEQMFGQKGRPVPDKTVPPASESQLCSLMDFEFRSSYAARPHHKKQKLAETCKETDNIHPWITPCGAFCRSLRTHTHTHSVALNQNTFVLQTLSLP